MTATDKRPVEMLNDSREIESLIFTQERWYAVGGRDGISRIVCYGEPGDGAYKPAFAIYFGDELEPRERVNWSAVTSVQYCTTPDGGQARTGT